MGFKTGLVIGLGVGYVLGTKAGKERYEQMLAATQRLMSSEAGQQVKAAATKVVEQVTKEEHAPAAVHHEGGNGKL
ncbi:MAG TPA: hypothetical protein VGB83_06180 [Actinomycetota bacterium]